MEKGKSRSDQQLVDRFQNGNQNEREKVYSRLYQRYERQIWWYFMRLTQNKQLAADLSQETFLRALRALDDFRGDSSFKTWLYRIASNLWKNYLKKKRPISGIVEENDRVESARPDQKVEENERISRVREAINELPPEMRAALLLVRFEGMKYREAADALDISMSAIKSRMGRAYHRLEDKLEMKESSEESL